MAIISNYFKREEYRDVIKKLKIVLDNFFIKKSLFNPNSTIRHEHHFALNAVNLVYTITSEGFI